MTLTGGDPAPDFTLPSDTGEEITLSALRGSKVVLYFYPKDSTPGCTTQACDYRDRKPAFADKGAVVLGVSKDSLESHSRFRGRNDLNFPLLSDPDLAVHKAFGAWGEKKNYGKTYMGVIRTTVVIDEQGSIITLDRNVKAKGNAERTLGKL